MVNLDDKICYCFHVPLRKLVHFARREKLQRPSQMSMCLGAGTGCGWCIPILKKIYEEARKPQVPSDDPVAGLPASPEEYAAARKDYLKSDSKNIF